MHRHRPIITPLDLPSPEQDLCEISMQLDQTDIGTYQQRVPSTTKTSKIARFDGWIRAEQKVAPHPELLLPLTERNNPVGSRQGGRRKASISTANNQFRVISSREHLQRVYSHQFHTQKNTALLKQSREFYLSPESSPTMVDTMRQRHKNNQKDTAFRFFSQQVQVRAVTYPIISNMAKGETPRKVVSQIGKIRHLINAKVKSRN